jgi:hypothetical protein
MHFEANCIFVIGLAHEELGKLFLPATICDKNLEHLSKSQTLN